jgi:APA family basic amino acid/polyamine antiporter
MIQPKKTLTLFDSTCLIVGIIIGAGIYETTPDIARGAEVWWMIFLLWIVGGFLSLCGALGYAELASTYPQAGGDYVYLTRAYGRWAGFLFGWLQLIVVRPGDIAAMAFIFARYAQKLYQPFSEVYLNQVAYAGSAVALLTMLNILGVKEGKWTQNLLTSVKVLGLLAVFAVALAGPAVQTEIQPAPWTPSLSLALILVLFTFGGWNEMAYVAAEMKHPQKTALRTILIGTIAVTVLYLLINGAFLYTLGYERMANSQAVAADTVSAALPNLGERLISALICISTLGAVNGLIFAGARITYAAGQDHRLFRFLGIWNPRTGTPVRSLGLQAGVALILVFALGSFKDTVIYIAATVYTFYLATSLAVLVLRRKEPAIPRPYKVTGYPLPTILFCGVCVLLIYSAVTYKPQIECIPFLILLTGIPVYWLTSRKS